MAKLERITYDPKVLGGKACVRGMRISVSVVLRLLAGGMSRSEILADYPYLEDADINECLEYAADLSEEWSYMPLEVKPATAIS